jgi:uncharacterized SAM-binding protein YcdF (DUF218 family)
MQPRRRLALVVVLLVVLAAGAVAGDALLADVPVDNPDAIVSLASHEWERLPETAALAQRYPRALIVLTEPPVVTKWNCHDCSHRIGVLGRAGVTADRIRVVRIAGPGTYGEAASVGRALRGAGVRRLEVVTSPYHTRRSLAVFRHAFRGTGVQIGVRPATASSPASPALWWMHPYDRAYVAYEWAALVYYAARFQVWGWQ